MTSALSYVMIKGVKLELGLNHNIFTNVCIFFSIDHIVMDLSVRMNNKDFVSRNFTFFDLFATQRVSNTISLLGNSFLLAKIHKEMFDEPVALKYSSHFFPIRLFLAFIQTLKLIPSS